MSALLDSLKQSYAASFPAVNAVGGLGQLRSTALAAAIDNDLPNTRQERWKYTNLRALAARSFAISSERSSIDAKLIAHIASPRIVLVNGVFDAVLSDTENLQDGISIDLLSEVVGKNDPAATQLFEKKVNKNDDVFAQLNIALSNEGILITVAPDKIVEKPLHLVFIGTSNTADLAVHLRHRIVLDQNARLTIVEHRLSVDSHRHLHNTSTDVHLHPSSALTHARIQLDSVTGNWIARTDAELASDAIYRSIDLELGSSLSRHELNVRLNGERAQLFANGMLLADGRRHIDTRLAIEHWARDTRCELTWRALATDRGRAVFHGGITIHPGADGASAQLSNKNILLSDTAEIDAQPVLEIHADEVQAAHGATVGQLDSNALFYLRSRGLSENQAKGLLMTSFLREPLSVFENDSLLESLSGQLDGAITRINH